MDGEGSLRRWRRVVECLRNGGGEKEVYEEFCEGGWQDVVKGDEEGKVGDPIDDQRGRCEHRGACSSTAHS